MTGDPPDAANWREVPELRARWEEWRRKGLRTIAFDPTIRDRLEGRGVRVIQGTDLGCEVDASIARHLGVPGANLCAGLKVAVFATLTAADAGAIPVDGEVVAFGGMEQGLDTAVVINSPRIRMPCSIQVRPGDP